MIMLHTILQEVSQEKDLQQKVLGQVQLLKIFLLEKLLQDRVFATGIASGTVNFINVMRISGTSLADGSGGESTVFQN